MKHYLRLMLGQRSVYAAECFANNYIGVDFGINEDLTGKLPEDWQTFNKIFVPKFLENHPDKSKIAAGLACGALWTVSKFFCAQMVKVDITLVKLLEAINIIQIPIYLIDDP